MDLAFSGKTILVTRSAGQSSQFTQLLQQQGATVIEMPTLEITAPSSWQALDGAIAQLNQFDWLILTSTNAVDYFWQRLRLQRPELQGLSEVKIAVVGQKTAQHLQQQGVQPDFTPPDFVADALIAHFPESLSGKKVLFPRVETGGREVLVREFTAQGATVTEVAAYESACPTQADPDAIAALINHQVDLVTFASAKTVKHFCKLVQQAIGSSWQRELAAVKVASIGPQTSKLCQELLSRVDVEAQEYTLDGLVQAMVQWAGTDATQSIDR